jgi:hypothetical protein
MHLYYKLRTLYFKNLLLSIAGSVLFLPILGSVNILLICKHSSNINFILEMILVTIATMSFLASALAQLKPSYVFNFFLIGVTFQFFFLVIKLALVS